MGNGLNSGRARTLAALAFCALAASASAKDGPNAAAKNAAAAFYAVYVTLPAAGVPDAAGLAKYEPTISPALHALLVGARKAEDNHFKATKNEEPPLFEGDLFSSLFEGASETKVGACKGDEKRAACAVGLTHDPKGKPVNWTDTAVVIATPDGWRLGDIVYGGTWDFGNKGRLSDALKSVTAQAGKTP